MGKGAARPIKTGWLQSVILEFRVSWILVAQVAYPPLWALSQDMMVSSTPTLPKVGAWLSGSTMMTCVSRVMFPSESIACQMRRIVSPTQGSIDKGSGVSVGKTLGSMPSSKSSTARLSLGGIEQISLTVVSLGTLRISGGVIRRSAAAVALGPFNGPLCSLFACKGCKPVKRARKAVAKSSWISNSLFMLQSFWDSFIADQGGL